METNEKKNASEENPKILNQTNSIAPWQRKRRLVQIFWAIFVCGLAISYSGSDFLITGGSLIMVVGYIGSLVTVFRYTAHIGRNTTIWTLGTLILPYIVPLILSLLPEVANHPIPSKSPITIPSSSSNPTGSNSVPTISGVRGVALSLDNLRIVTLVLPGETRSRWNPLAVYSHKTESSETIINIDLLEENNFLKLMTLLPSIPDNLVDAKTGEPLNERRKLQYLDQIKFYLKDYQQNVAVMSMKNILLSGNDFLGKLSSLRPARITKLSEWLATHPEVIVGNSLSKSRRATLGIEGFRVGKHSMSWSEVGTIRRLVQKETFYTSAYIIAEPVDPQKKVAKWLEPSAWYRIPVPHKRLMLETAEFYFWRAIPESKIADTIKRDKLESINAT